MGNLFYPLLEEIPNLFVHACDFSPRAVQFVKVSELTIDKGRASKSSIPMTL